MAGCRWWEREQGRWAVQGDGLYIPEEPPVEEGGRGGILMRTTGAALESELQRREESRGTGAGGIRYHLFTGIYELRARGVLAGARAMANRVYAGQSWWVEGNRTNIECLYRKQARACPTRFIIAVAGGGITSHTQADGDESQPEETAEIEEERDATEERRAREGRKGRATAKDPGAPERLKRRRTGDG